MNHAAARAKHNRKLLRAHKAGEAGKFDVAEKIYRGYIAKYPEDDQVLFNLGVLVQRREKSPEERVEAINWYQRCIAAPGSIWTKSNAANNCGLIMGKINQIGEATIFFHLAIQMNPNNAAARVNFGDMLRHNGDYKEADREFVEVLRLDPNSAAAKFSAGMIALMLGDFKRGFELYESRFDVESCQTPKFKSDKPEWNGEYLNGKAILLTTEQGHGDAIMFVRYAREIKKRFTDCDIVFRGDNLFRNLFKGVDGLDYFFATGEQLPEYDYHCPIMSLPHKFGTTIETVPNETPYIRPVAGWELYSDYDGHETSLPKQRIGLVWAGSPRHGKDAFRSLQPEMLQPLIDAHPEIQFYSLQVGPKADECARLRDIIDLAPTITDWTDTAQALLQLDLLISVDTAVVHLCGALGKPCWMLTPFSPDWRWMLTREDSTWYPKMKLFRQPHQGDWATPLKRIYEAL